MSNIFTLFIHVLHMHNNTAIYKYTIRYSWNSPCRGCNSVEEAFASLINYCNRKEFAPRGIPSLLAQIQFRKGFCKKESKQTWQRLCPYKMAEKLIKNINSSQFMAVSPMDVISFNIIFPKWTTYRSGLRLSKMFALIFLTFLRLEESMWAASQDRPLCRDMLPVNFVDCSSQSVW